LQKKSLTDIDFKILETASPEIKQLVLFLLDKIEQLTIMHEQAQQRILELEQENAKLRSQLNQNSKNSSRPPSSDGYKKKSSPNLSKLIKEGEKKNHGGQIGHKGDTLLQVAEPDKVLTHRPSSHCK